MKTIKTYYYIDFKDLDIYSNEGESTYNEQDKANFLIGNEYQTFHQAKNALYRIILKNSDGKQALVFNCATCNDSILKTDAIETDGNIFICQACDSKRLECENCHDKGCSECFIA